MGSPSPLEAARIREFLGTTEFIGRELVVLEEVGSTNDEVARRAEKGAREGLVVFAEHQSQGRGRRGARWQSSPGENLLFSVLLRPPGGAGGVPWLPAASALALCRVFGALHSLSATIKWPNDVYLAGGLKVAGILTEGRRGSEVVLGIGINVNTP
ncbi:MAG: biotin--[acetyl-CoA-carboxylase] ligase, partial [Verrucomicrobiales bacterium]